MDVLFVAGEASGDLHGAGVAAALKRRRPDLHLVGIGGQKMKEAGVELIEDFASIAVMGFVEVLTHLPRHYALLRALKKRLRSGQVGLLICIDYPGFNLELATAAHEAGVPVLYYIAPQVWAWGAKRLPKMARIITHAAVILPFEEALLTQHHIPTTFVGHPLLDRAQTMPDRATARTFLGIGAHQRVLALFPGSRVQEIDRHLDRFVETARLIQSRAPDIEVVVSVAPGISIDTARCPFRLIPGASFSVLRAADAALCKSGTTTLEAAVAGCPCIVMYRTSRWTYAIARRVVKIPRIGLVNVVADREVAREFVQDAAVPERMADALIPLLTPNTPECNAAIAGLASVRDQLGTPGAAERVAAMADAMAAQHTG